MHVYELQADLDNYETFEGRTNHENRRLRSILGELPRDEPVGPGWPPIQLKVSVDSDRRKRDPAGDFTIAGEVLIFYERAAAALRSFLTNDVGEVLALKCPGRSVSGFHVLKVVDGLDYSKCKTTQEDERLPGLVTDLDSYAFIPSKIRQQHLFRIPQLLLRFYCSDEFVRAAIAADLRGFDFRLVWSRPKSGPPPAIPMHLIPKASKKAQQ